MSKNSKKIVFHLKLKIVCYKILFNVNWQCILVRFSQVNSKELYKRVQLQFLCYKICTNLTFGILKIYKALFNFFFPQKRQMYFIQLTANYKSLNNCSQYLPWLHSSARQGRRSSKRFPYNSWWQPVPKRDLQSCNSFWQKKYNISQRNCSSQRNLPVSCSNGLIKLCLIE